MAALDAAFVKRAALECGFHKVGVARADPLDPRPLDRFLAHGWQADMAWLGAQREVRLDPAKLLPGARSVVALAVGYAVPGLVGPEEGFGRVARYARGRDYHAVLKKKLKAFRARLAERDPEARTFAGADLGPIMEKAWAARAGIGWVGKNGCLLTTDLGSWVLLAALIIDRELEPDAPHPERCGSCAACLDACPTGAIPEPGFVDARRCLSFWTIERRGDVPAEVAARLGPWGFGCDDCQTVCPWNLAAGERCDPELLPREGRAALDLDAVLRLTEEEYRARFYGTSLARARYEGLVRNAALAAAQAGDARRVPLLRPLLASPFEGVRAAARFALARLDPAAAGPGPD
ncbi:tRNA epoxyqueuosine(34) reductase QueG [Anaeromyxobacter paludicola]|uniref:Epoxyqueuosine reductase n=1 Tax=Anaeromyxobacter paludicola TaxID=2918171 RepID=A0ABN6NCJ0_9BACT|nr:tRNA epoxyqueuosine(34) reductase QueG [Anaeromyxobacter paludicola]BDG10806.1 epoxyqueuosine reductase [Anaeromyxobacter paludicola]